MEGTRFCRTCRRTYRSGVQTCPLDRQTLEPLPTELPLPGQWVHRRYLVQDRIADGGMGVVFLALDGHRRHPVALKVLRPSMAMRETAVQRFFREARAAGRLSHPNIVGLFDFGVSAEGWIYLAMEHVVGETLARRLGRRGRLTVAETLLTAHAIAEALVHAHFHRVIHRDLKPENILIGSQDPDGGMVKVLDFGIAAIADIPMRGGLDRGEVLGTPAYMSPEQIRGDTVDPRSDLYSLGVLIFEMLAGRPPFEGATPLEVMRCHLREQPPSLPALALDVALRADLQALVRDLLRKAPEERPPDAATVRSRIRGLLDRLTLMEVEAQEGRLISQVLSPLRALIPFHERPTLDLASFSVPAREPATEASGEGLAWASKRLAPPPMAMPRAPVRLVSIASVAEWEVSASWRIVSDDPAGEERTEEVFAALVHAEFDWETQDPEGPALFRPEVDAFETAVMARGACLCFDDGRELRLVHGFHDARESPVPEALASALDLARRVSRFRRDTGFPVHLRIGLASGRLPRRLMQVTAPDLEVRGSRLDLAVRLCRMALSGQVLLDEDSRRHLPPVPVLPVMARVPVRGSLRPRAVHVLSVDRFHPPRGA